MKKIWGLLFLTTALLLGACSDDKDQPTNQSTADDGEVATGSGAIDHGIDENGVGITVTGDTVEEASNVPAEEKKQILAAFDIYIDAFNDKDIDRYIDTLSANTESFDKEQERTYMTDEVFNLYDLDREASDVTIVKYSETEAQVFAELKTKMKQIATGLEVEESGRQVTLFVKEENDWKVSSVYYIGNQ